MTEEVYGVFFTAGNGETKLLTAFETEAEANTYVKEEYEAAAAGYQNTPPLWIERITRDKADEARLKPDADFADLDF